MLGVRRERRFAGLPGRRRASLVGGVMVAVCAAGVAFAFWRAGGEAPGVAGIGPPSIVPRTIVGYEGPQSVVFSGQAADGTWAARAVSPRSGSVTSLVETDWPVVASPDGRRLAVLRDNAVFIHDARTGERLSRAKSSTLGFSWSRDGRWVSGFGTIAAADGSSARRVAHGAGISSLSPDGSHLVYRLRAGLWIVAADNSWRRRLTPPGTGVARRPRWSPRGDLIAFVQRDGVYVIAPDGSGLRKVGRDWSYEEHNTVGPHAFANLAWSPDGRKLAYVSRQSGGEEIYVADVATGRERRLTSGVAGQISYEPAWSLDGRWIAFTRTRAGSIFVVRPDGRALRELTPGFEYAREATWRRGDVAKAGGQRPVPEVTLRAAAEIEMPGPIEQLESDGFVVAILPPADEWHESCGRIPVWNAGTGSLQRVRAVRTCTDSYTVKLAFGGGRLFALSGYAPPFQQGATETELTATRLADPKLEVAATGWWTEEDAGTEITAVEADGDAAVYSVDDASLDDRSPASVQSWRSGEQRDVTGARAAGEVLAVDETGRILVQRPSGLWLLARDGSVVQRLRLPAPADGRVAEGRVVALSAGNLIVYDALTGRVLLRTQLAGKTEPLQLADADHEIALVVLGGRLRLIRLSDGKQVELRTPPGTTPVASLEAEGLFYATGSRLAFVTREELALAFH